MKGTAGLWTGERRSGQGRDCPGTFSAVMPGCIVSRRAWAQGGSTNRRNVRGWAKSSLRRGQVTTRQGTVQVTLKHTQSLGMRILGYHPCSSHPVTSIW